MPNKTEEQRMMKGVGENKRGRVELGKEGRRKEISGEVGRLEVEAKRQRREGEEREGSRRPGCRMKRRRAGWRLWRRNKQIILVRPRRQAEGEKKTVREQERMSISLAFGFVRYQLFSTWVGSSGEELPHNVMISSLTLAQLGRDYLQQGTVNVR